LKIFRDRFGAPTALVAAGGVAANEAIRKALQRSAFEAGTALVVPPAALCTDNGAMIAWAGAERLALGLTDTLAAAPHARWLLSDVTGPPLPATVAAPAQDVAPQAPAPEPVQAPVQERPGADAPEPQ
jgi:N6-L-threonylcarbamoyladenine synthase